MKKRNLRLIVIGCAVAGAGLLYGLIQSIACKGIASSEAAGWVQAVGSIAAIIGAYYVGERQASANLANAIAMEEAASIERRDAYLAIAFAANDALEQIQKYFGKTTLNKLMFFTMYDARKIDDLIDAMGSVPLNELGSASRVSAWLAFKHGLMTFQRSVDRYRTGDFGATDATAMPNRDSENRQQLSFMANLMATKFVDLVQCMTTG
jgi:hypothetical protein